MGSETDLRVRMRDGVHLVADVHRPRAAGQKFPVLLSLSPYTRELQASNLGLAQNEAGITQFWVPRGYVHIIADVRGSGGAEGRYDNMGEAEQRDYVELIEWCATRPWSNGSVGMMGCSYFALSQLLAAVQQPEPLKAIFPYDAFTDEYRHHHYHGGIPFTGFMWFWYGAVSGLNLATGRLADPSGIQQMIREGLTFAHPLDGEFYRTRSTWHRLDRIQIPAYFGCDWSFWWLHLPGAFDGWENTGNIPKRLLVGPRPEPWRPFAAYHGEALRWYDQWLKGMDTGVMEGPPIQLYIEGEGVWRSENEWPLARAQWRRFHLGGPPGMEGALLDSPQGGGERSYTNDPLSPGYRMGEPRLIYRSAPLEEALEVTGPVCLHLRARSTSEDTDWLVTFMDEAPDGSARILSAGWLRSSHRETDPTRSRPGQPWHPHNRTVPLAPGKEETFEIGLVPTCNYFRPAHRLRLEIASCAPVGERIRYHDTLLLRSENTILEGKDGSHLLVSAIPR